jgi:aminoglycoside phosphotransferase (APT) family kinase protein
MPAVEVSIPVGLVRRLLAAQQPDVAHLPIEVMANGWDNLLCRLGGELVVRMPRRGWALALSLAILAHSADNPLMAEIGHRTIDAVLA